MIQFIKNALREVFLSFSPQRCQIEAMMKFDFKIGHERTNLMQLCFSALAAWPLLLILAVLYFDPSRLSWSLQQTFRDQPQILFWLLDGRLANMAEFFVIFFVLQWIFRQEFVFISVLFYFLLKSDLHLHLAVSGVLAIIFARDCYLWWMFTDLKSNTRRTWTMFTGLQIAGWFVGAVVTLWALDYFQANRFFAESVIDNRFQFLFWALLIIYFFQFFVTCAWGHFSFQKKKEPTDLPISYSTTTWILRFKMRPYFKKQIKDQIEKYLELHQQNLNELQTIKDLSPVSIPGQIGNILKIEIEYLKTAASRLTID